MKKLGVLALVGFLSAWPSVARADSGFIEWLDSFSGPGPFWGYAYQTRIFCSGTNGIQKCVSDIPNAANPDVKWILTAEGGFYSSSDNVRFSDTPKDTRSVHLVTVVPKLMYRVHPMLDVGGGVGVMFLSGDGFDFFARPEVPLQVTITPLGLLKNGQAAKWGRFFRFNLATVFVGKGLTGADLSSPSTYSQGGEFHKSFAFIFDFGVFRAP